MIRSLTLAHGECSCVFRTAQAATKNLPGFIVLNSGLIPPGGMDCFTNGFLPAAYQGSLFREGGAFEADVAGLCDAMRSTLPVDPSRPVMVAGDPERRAVAERMASGIPVGANLLAKVRAIAEECGVPWMLGTAKAA